MAKKLKFNFILLTGVPPFFNEPTDKLNDTNAANHKNNVFYFTIIIFLEPTPYHWV